ncbi:Short-chain dehydrogenase/reductase SDR [Penicillium camemberti]|uniref:Short-chain dehydrogenase/reductase SDR n=1 Tax=Penicillium camemberti (strain FM 013) TaxID=1429867 RepID=A0A0G4PAW9_PENC3|nr:Short-chain dehydrogenase/reductase SDR [Penicillium camemberti]
MDVSGVALITGGASGIGRACAKTFARDGASGIALLDISPKALEAVKAEIEEQQSKAGATPCRVLTYPTNITDENRVNEVVQEVARTFGRLDYVVNAAGIAMKHAGGAAFCETSDWERILNVNLTGTFFVLRAAAKIMLKQEPIKSSIDGRPLQRGSIVNFSSIQGVAGIALSTAYTATKHAVIGLTRTASEDYAKDGLRINAICPGYTETPLTTKSPQILAAMEEKVANAVPMERMGQPGEIADGVVYLSGGRASFVTGTALFVDERHYTNQPTLTGRTFRNQRISAAHIPELYQKADMSTHRVPIAPQRVDAPLTQSATFLVLSVTNKPDAIETVRSTLAGVDSLAKNVSIRDLSAQFACTVGIGSDIWDRLTGLPRPSELRPFREIKGEKHTAVSTTGDLLFHIRSERRDICFEFERQLMDQLGDSVSVVDETVGFRYFDVRDLLGFVDGTANPVGLAVPASVLVAEEDASASGGSYIVVQKYTHDLPGWKDLSTEQQERIIGRTKIDNVELDDAKSGQRSHKTLNTIEDEDGNEHDILRDNMPFGSPGAGEFGTYFIGYTRRLWVIERMLERMFIGDPPGLHDRILDFSKPLTGTTFFAPSASLLASLGSD